MGFSNGQDSQCPASADFKQSQSLLSEILAEIKLLRESLVGPATDSERVPMKFVRETGRRSDWVTAGLLLYCILITIWFTGVKPQIEKKSGDSSFSAGFGAEGSGENKLPIHQ